jgi:hypothetical protein
MSKVREVLSRVYQRLADFKIRYNLLIFKGPWSKLSMYAALAVVSIIPS